MFNILKYFSAQPGIEGSSPYNKNNHLDKFYKTLHMAGKSHSVKIYCASRAKSENKYNYIGKLNFWMHLNFLNNNDFKKDCNVNHRRLSCTHVVTCFKKQLNCIVLSSLGKIYEALYDNDQRGAWMTKKNSF